MAASGISVLLSSFYGYQKDLSLLESKITWEDYRQGGEPLVLRISEGKSKGEERMITVIRYEVCHGGRKNSGYVPYGVFRKWMLRFDELIPKASSEGNQGKILARLTVNRKGIRTVVIAENTGKAGREIIDIASQFPNMSSPY